MQRPKRPVELDRAHKESLGSEQLFLVLGIMKHASRALDPPTFFRLLVDSIYREVKLFSHVSIFSWDPDRAQVRAMAVAGEGGEGLLPGEYDAASGALAEAIGHSSSYVSNNLRNEVRGIRPVAPLSRSVLCIPIRAGERILALLNIESRETNVFSAAEVALFEILCEQLANFLHGVSLYGEINEKNAKIHRITDICRRVFGAGSVQEALQLSVRAVVEEYGYFAACVAFITEDGRFMVLQAHHARVAVQIPPLYKQEIGRGIVGTVAAERHTVICNDTDAERSYVPLLPGVRSELCIPLLVGEKLVGVLDVSGCETNSFDNEDVNLMETLAGQLALIMDKAIYLERTRVTRDYLENLIANAGDGILALDLQGRINRWNLMMERLTGYAADEILGRTFHDLQSGGILHRTEETVSRALKGEILEGLEDTGVRKDGKAIDVVLTVSPIRGPDNTLEGISVIVRDITEWKRMEETFQALHQKTVESEEKFLELVETARDAIFFVEADTGLVVEANSKAEYQTGSSRAELVGRSFLDLHMAEEREHARQQFQGTVGTGAGHSVELRLARSRGQPLDVEVTSSILSYNGRNVVQWFCRDISDRRRAEREKDNLQTQLLQTEKMSAIGQLISGVAHELNNPLTGVIGYSQLLLGQDADEKTRRGLEKVYAEARRCHRIVQNLLTFARKHTPEKKSISINDILEATIELRSYQLRVDNISVEMLLSKDLPSTQGDFHQLQQVFMNIVINAHQAMKESGPGGHLVVKSSLVNELIRVEIADNGPGIPPEAIKKIFDPFFTTKPTGQGTGLGLSICYGIIQEHDGNIYTASTLGQGTVFTVDLPVLTAGASVAEGSESEIAAAALGPPAEHSRRLLVVDDEPAIVEVLSEALRAHGHQVDTAPNGRLALKKILAGKYDAVISDLRMPGMNGQTLYKEAIEAKPGLANRFLFATGDTIARETQDFLDRTGKPWIEKPFDVLQVVSLVGRMCSS